MAPDEPDVRGETVRRVGTVYEVGGWRLEVDPPGQRWGATCAKGEVFRGHTKEEVQAQVADHECDPNETAFFKRASTDADWAAAQLALLPGGRPAPPPRGLGDTVEAFDSREFDRQGRLYRSALKHWSPSLKVTCLFQTGSASFKIDAHGERGLAQFLDLVLNFPDEPSVVRLYLEPNTFPSPGQLSNLRFDFDRERQVAAAVLLAVGKNDEIHRWMSRGDAGRDDVVLAHDTWNAGDTRFPPESFVTVAEMRAAVIQWAFGEGLLPPPSPSAGPPFPTWAGSSEHDCRNTQHGQKRRVRAAHPQRRIRCGLQRPPLLLRHDGAGSRWALGSSIADDSPAQFQNKS